jgi:hypothetical protein
VEREKERESARERELRWQATSSQLFLVVGFLGFRVFWDIFGFQIGVTD